MADLALLRDALLHVVGIGRVLVSLQVTRNARFGRQVVIPIHVALAALHRGMRAGEGEADQVVIEAGWLPGVSRVTLLAVLRESRRNVVRICSLLIVRQVAAHTIGGRPFIFPADVARRAVQRGVHAGQSEPGELQVIEGRAEPRVHAVA